MLPPIHTDHRFIEAIELLDRGDCFEASELFEELYFEAIRDEVEFARFFLQLSVGLLHAERGQASPAVERLDEALKAAARIADWRGFDGEAFIARASSTIASMRARAR